MANCPSCGSPPPEAGRLCACGWDFVAQKNVLKPAAPRAADAASSTEAAGLELFFKPAPAAPNRPAADENPPPAYVRGTGQHLDLASAPAPEPAPKAEPPAPTGFPSNLLNPLLESLRRTEAGRTALNDPNARAVVAALRKPPVFIAVVMGLALWGATTLYVLWPDSARAPKAAVAAPVESGRYVRHAATFAATPKVLVDAAGSAPTAAAPAAAPAP